MRARSSRSDSCACARRRRARGCVAAMLREEIVAHAARAPAPNAASASSSARARRRCRWPARAQRARRRAGCSTRPTTSSASAAPSSKRIAMRATLLAARAPRAAPARCGRHRRRRDRARRTGRGRSPTDCAISACTSPGRTSNSVNGPERRGLVPALGAVDDEGALDRQSRQRLAPSAARVGRLKAPMSWNGGCGGIGQRPEDVEHRAHAQRLRAPARRPSSPGGSAARTGT